MHLSFEIVNSGAAIQIYCDQAGLEKLLDTIKLAKQTGHTHIRASADKNSILSLKTPWDKDAVAEVIITTGGD